MRDDSVRDPAVLLMSALADEIADRIASRLAPQLAELVEAGGLKLVAPYEKPDISARGDMSANETAAGKGGFWTARRVASHYDVAVRFVYEHADELGCVRLGGGPRPRLRFDPQIVRERWPRVGDKLLEPKPTRRRRRPRSTGHDPPGRVAYELLDFDPQP